MKKGHKLSSKSKNLDGNVLSREGRASWRCFEKGWTTLVGLKIQSGGIHVLNKAKIKKSIRGLI